MATNLELDNELIREAMKWGKHQTKRAAVTAALENYIWLKNLAIADDGAGKVARRAGRATSNRRSRKKTA